MVTITADAESSSLVLKFLGPLSLDDLDGVCNVKLNY